MYYSVDEKNKRYITNGKESLPVGSEDLAKVSSQKIMTRQEAVVLSDLRLRGLVELFLRMYRGGHMFSCEEDGEAYMKKLKSDTEDFSYWLRSACEDREDFILLNDENDSTVQQLRFEGLKKILKSTEEEEIQFVSDCWKIKFSSMEGKLILPPLWAMIAIMHFNKNPLFYNLREMIMEGVIEL